MKSEDPAYLYGDRRRSPAVSSIPHVHLLPLSAPLQWASHPLTPQPHSDTHSHHFPGPRNDVKRGGARTVTSTLCDHNSRPTNTTYSKHGIGASGPPKYFPQIDFFHLSVSDPVSCKANQEQEENQDVDDEALKSLLTEYRERITLVRSCTLQ